MKKISLLGLLVILLVSRCAEAKALKDTDFTVLDIQARLLYERTGVLSEDTTKNPEFIFWNTCIGEGSAKEPANDLLITALIKGPGEHNLKTPLSLIVLNSKGRVIASREFTNLLADKTSYQSLLLSNTICDGDVKLVAKLGKSIKTEILHLNCGE